MKVKVGNEVFLMHWETRKFSPKNGKNTELELEATDCIIRKVTGQETSVEVARGHVSQTACDQANSVVARRLSFLKAIKELPRSVRKALGDEYNKTCRVITGTQSKKTRKLKNQVAELKAKIKELELAAKKEEAIA